MASYRIPQHFLSGFKALSKLKDSSAKQIAEYIQNFDTGVKSDLIIESAKKDIQNTGLTEDELTKAFETIFSLINLKDQTDEKTENLIGDLVDSFRTQDDSATIDTENLKNNLSLLLTTRGNINLTIKALKLLGEYEKILVDTRIITDVRFVFEENIEKNSNNAVIVHQLKISFNENDKLRDNYFALDANDLKSLRDNIERALKKEELIKKMNFSEKINFITLDNQ